MYKANKINWFESIIDCKYLQQIYKGGCTFMRKIIIAILAFIVGLIPGFFIVFNSVFSDSNGSLNERLFTFLLVIVVYVILGFIFGVIEKSNSWITWASLSLAAIIILVLYSFKETTLIGLNILYACLTVGSCWLGSYLEVSFKKTNRWK